MQGDTGGTLSAKLRGLNKAIAAGIGVTGTFWQSVQPVSFTMPSLVAGTAVIGHVIVDTAPTTAVTGTFWQVTQPVSFTMPALVAGSAVIGHVIVDTAPTTAVTGTFWQATQPVSGTFWQATQPVSGTFWQATQPISAASLPLPTNAATDASVTGLEVSQASTTSGQKGIVIQGAVSTNAPSYTTAQTDPLSLDPSGLLRVSLKDTPANTNKLLVTPDSVALPANQSVNISQINAATPLMGNGSTGTGSPRVTIASDNTAFSVNDVPPTLTKGTQGATGFSTQDLKDAGRQRVTFTADRVTPAATDTLVSFVINVGGTATTAQTTRTVTSGKTFRLQAMHIGAADTTTTALSVRVAFRENTGGTCTASSAAAIMLNTATPAAIAAEGSAGADFTVPDGLEFPAADSLCLSAIASTSTGTLTVTVVGFEY